MRNICEVEDCSNHAVAYGLCDKHRQRLKKHGHLKQTRPDDWGKKEKHHLYNTWCWMRKMRSKHSIVQEWEDFWKFVKDVGDRPSDKHQLRRKDNHGNYSPENCHWVEVSSQSKSRKEYTKQWRENNPEKVKNQELRKMFGITLEDYNKMWQEQQGKCKICGVEESYEGYSLAVDHCHDTGKVRGLLCSNCNRGLGFLKDSVDNLKAAITYLKS